MFNQVVRIGNRDIKKDTDPYIVAEMSANHNRDFDLAIRMLDEAKEAGADAIKIQTYDADDLTLNSSNEEFQINHGLWAGYGLHDLYSNASMPYEWHNDLFEHANKIGLTIFSSPFSLDAVKYLEAFNCVAYKIASFELVDIPLIKACATTGKPIILSTGMANSEDIELALKTISEQNNRNVILLHCVSGYPSLYDEANLLSIINMAKEYKVLTGLSDHSLGLLAPIVATVLGAVLIEKHFVIDRLYGGLDSSFSLDKNELRQLCKQTKFARRTLGSGVKKLQSSEKENSNYRRSLYTSQKIKAGEIFNSDNIKSIRPALGIEPKYYEDILGKKAKIDIDFAVPLSWDLVSDD